MDVDTVLIIDDEPMIRHLVARVLDRAGYPTVSAANGRQGLARFHQYRPVLVITDIIMPEREGIETIRQIRREAPSLPIIAISGSTRVDGPDFLAMARELGATDVLRKPFEPLDLLARVTRCLGAPRLVDRV